MKKKEPFAVSELTGKDGEALSSGEFGAKIRLDAYGVPYVEKMEAAGYKMPGVYIEGKAPLERELAGVLERVLTDHANIERMLRGAFFPYDFREVLELLHKASDRIKTVHNALYALDIRPEVPQPEEKEEKQPKITKYDIEAIEAFIRGGK